MEDIVIVGSGCAGYAAAIYSARADFKPLVLAGDQPGGQLTTTSDIENYPGFIEPVGGFDLTDAMRQQAERFGARVEYDTVVAAQCRPGGPQALTLASGKELSCRALIVATGASPRKLGLPSEKQLENKGVAYCAVCDGSFFKGLDHVVVGGGDTAMEEATYLSKLANKVYLIHRRNEFRASRIMAERVLANPKIEVVWDSAVAEVRDVRAGKVTGVVLRHLKTEALREVPCGALFVAIGHVPNTQPFQGQVAMDESGYIVLDGVTSRTSCPGVFAAGDCADHLYRQAVTAAGMGCRAALDAARWLETQS